MNDVKAQLLGAEYHLLFNGAAMFAAQELCGDKELSELLFENTSGGLETLVHAFCIMAEQGELARRYDGFDAQSIPDAERMRLTVMPMDLPSMRATAMKAILKGYGREVEEDETDLGLAELQKKTKAP